VPTRVVILHLSFALMESGSPPSPPPTGAPGTPEKPPIARKPSPPEPEPTTPTLRAAQPPPQPRIEDLDARVTNIDRNLRIRIDAVLAATLFSLLAAIAAIVLVVSANDESATKDQVHALRNDVEGVGHKAAAAAKDVNSISSRLDAVEANVSTLSGTQSANQHELSAVQSDVKDLRKQMAKLKDAVARESAANRKSAASP
jgi:uncharacterized protein HemX